MFVTNEENNTDLLEIFIVGKGVEEEVVESVLQLQQVLGKQEEHSISTYHDRNPQFYTLCSLPHFLASYTSCTSRKRFLDFEIFT
jgi:hypothetical protein